MMKYEKSVTINLGNYNSVRIGVTEAESLEAADREIRAHLAERKIDVSKIVLGAIQEKK